MNLLRKSSKLWPLVSLGLYALIFKIRIPEQITFKGIEFIDLFLILISCIIIYYSFRKNYPGWKIISLLLALIIFTLPLIRLWENAESNYNLILGMIPWSDAAGYYSDAVSLSQGNLLGGFSGNRPLFASLLSTLIRICNGNIQIITVVFVVINSLAVFLFAIEVGGTYGPFVATLLIFLLNAYYHQFAGALMTEQLGLPLGLLGTSLLIFGSRTDNQKYQYIGLFLLSMALLARAGAFFILPTIIIFVILISIKRKNISIRAIFIPIAIVLFAFGGNFLLGKLVSDPNSVPMGNFSYTFYGQAVGGKGWTQIFIDHPEISNLPNLDQPMAVYKLAINEIIRHPSGITTGVINAYKDFFIPSQFAAFGYIQPGDKLSSPIIQTILTFFFFIGIFFCWKHRNEQTYSLLLIVFLGIFISIPFIPPSESSGMRVYAATIAIPALIAGIGISGLFVKLRNASQEQNYISGQTQHGQVILGMVLIFVATFGAYETKISNAIETNNPVSCPIGETPIQIQPIKGAYVQINTNESGQPTFVPNISARDFRQSMRRFPGIYHTFSDFLINTLTPPVIITYSRNMLTGDFIWIISDRDVKMFDKDIIRTCAKPIENNFFMIYMKSDN